MPAHASEHGDESEDEKNGKQFLPNEIASKAGIDGKYWIEPGKLSNHFNLNYTLTFNNHINNDQTTNNPLEVFQGGSFDENARHRNIFPCLQLQATNHIHQLLTKPHGSKKLSHSDTSSYEDDNNGTHFESTEPLNSARECLRVAHLYGGLENVIEGKLKTSFKMEVDSCEEVSPDACITQKDQNEKEKQDNDKENGKNENGKKKGEKERSLNSGSDSRRSEKVVIRLKEEVTKALERPSSRLGSSAGATKSDHTTPHFSFLDLQTATDACKKAFKARLEGTLLEGKSKVNCQICKYQGGSEGAGMSVGIFKLRLFNVLRKIDFYMNKLKT